MSSTRDNFPIFIALPSDDVCTLKGLSREMFVCELKSRVELKAGIPGNIFNLYFMNIRLSDQDSLKVYNLKHGCIVRVKIEQNWISLFEACWRGDIYDVFENGVQFLDEEKLQGYNISVWNKLVIQRATFALFISCHRGYLGLIMELINRGATDINGKTIFGRSALHVAAYQGFVGCVSLLLSEGAICNQIDIQGKTPLALANENGHVYCERRLWLYQWNLQTFRRPSSRSSSGESAEFTEHEARKTSKSPESARLPSTRRTYKQPDQNNNEKQTMSHQAIHLRLPRVANNENKTTLHRTKSHERPRSSLSPFPLMQIAEKYRKELRELNEGPLHLPTHAQGDSKEENQTAGPDTPQLKETWKDEVEVVKDANGVNYLEKDEQNTVIAEISKEKKDGDSSQEKSQDNRDTPAETGLQDFDRPPSGRTNGIRKLDIVMGESKEKCKMESTLREREAGEYEEEQAIEHDNTLLDLRQEYSGKKPAQTFENWLQMKQSQEKTRPCTAPVQKSRLGKSIDPESFKRWLNSKRLQRSHPNSESSTSSNRKNFVSSGGLTFDRWLETKLTKRPVSAMGYVTESRDDHASGASNKVRRQITSGKPFELWLAEKKTVAQATHDGENNDREDKNTPKLSGKSFDEWLQDKTKQKQIELVQKITTEKEQQRLAEIDQLSKWLNPHYKTYEDWLALKNYQANLQRVRTQNEPQRQQEEIPFEEKRKDAKVVYNIWQTMKALQDLSDEEKKYNEMKAKWAAKEREKEQLKRLNIANKAKKHNFHVKSASAKS